MCLKIADSVANNVNPDQMPHIVGSGSTLFVQACLSEMEGKYEITKIIILPGILKGV